MNQMPMRVRYGSWAEFVSVGEGSLVHKPESYTFSQVSVNIIRC